MKLTFKKVALLGFAIVTMFVLVGCTETTTTTTTTSGQTTVTLSDTQKVQAVLDGITLGDISAVTTDLTLPTASVNGVSLSWSTEDADYITATGEISIPDYTTGDQVITLTLTATLNAVTLTKTFDVTVKAESATVFLNRVGAGIIIDSSDSIVANFKLPSTSQGATITWTSSDVAAAAISTTVGSDTMYTVTITRQKVEESGVNVSVTLTGVLTIGETSVTITKTIRIIAEPAATVYTTFAALHSTALLNDYVDVTGIVYVKFNGGYFLVDSANNYLAVYTTATYFNAVAVGDNVRIKGLYKNYNTLYQLSNLTFQQVLSSSNAFTITPQVLTDATDLKDINASTDKLVHGKAFTITVTVKVLSTGYVDIYVGTERVGTVYSYSLADSINALKTFDGKVVTIDVYYYALHGTNGVMVLFAGAASDIELAPLVGQEALDADAAAISLPANVVGGQSVTLPAVGGYSSAIAWSVTTGGTYATIASGKITFAEVSAQQTVTITASLTIDGVSTPTTRVFSFTVTPITTSTIAQVWTMSKDAIAQVEGTVYFFINNGYFVFDGTGMLFIYTTAPAGTLLGDKIVIFGTVDIYNGQHQIKNAIVKSKTSSGNAHTQTPITYVPGTTPLVSGQTYSITATIKEITSGGYTNLFFFSGETQLAQIYYRSTINDSFAALTANKDREVIVNVVYYYTQSSVIYFVYQEGAAGITYTPAQQAAINVQQLTTKTSVVSAEEVALPAAFQGSTITWAVKDANVNATIAAGIVTYETVTQATQVTLVATLTYTPAVGDPIVNTKEFVVTISTYAEKIADDVAALTVALTAKELDVITLPTTGLNGSAITWALTATDNATLAVNVLTLKYLGSEYSVTVTATLAFAASPETTGTKEFIIVVSPIVIVTDFAQFNAKTGTEWTFAGTDMMYIKGIVSAKNGTSGFFVQDALGNGIYAHGSHTVLVGDEVIIYTKLGVYNSVRQLNTWSVKTVLSQGNDVLVSSMTLAELAAIVPNFYEYASMLVNVEGIVIKEFRGNYLDMIWANVVNGEVTTVYMLSFYYNNSTYSWLKDVYEVGDALPAFNFVFYNIFATTTFNILPQSGLVITDQQAVDLNASKLPTTLELSDDYVLPTATFGTSFAITAISTELASYITSAGVVTLPETTDVVGTITITVSKDELSQEVIIAVTIKAMTDAQKLAVDSQLLLASLLIKSNYTLPTLAYATYDSVVISTELQSNLTNVAGVLTPVRPEATLVGTVTITISVGIEEFVKIIDVSIKRAASESFDFEAAITGMGTSYLDINDIVLNGTTGLSLDIHRVAQTTPTGKTNKALVISPRTGTVSGGASDGIAFAAFDYGTKIINEVEFDIYFWNSSAEAFFTKIELQAKVDGVWVTVMDLKAVITGSVNTFHIVANGLNTSEFRIYTEGGKLNANDARVCIDNLEIYTAPIE